MTTKVVISKYNEDVNWVKDIKYETIIYDKSNNPVEGSIPRPNIGREAETLLYYIIEHYNNLPDITIFLQGDPRSNPISFTYQEVIDEVNKDHKCELKTILTWEGNTIDSDYWLKSVEILNSILFVNGKQIKYSSGVQYVIPKEIILNRPLRLYEVLYDQVIKYGYKGLVADKKDLSDGIDAWTMELIWGSIFNVNLKLTDDYILKINELS
jgi:hypothetical protein